MEKRKKAEMRMKRNVSHICLLLLAVVQISTPSSAQNTTTTVNPAALSYRTQPAGVRVAVGEPAVFRCGVPAAFPNLTFTYYGSHGTYILKCPHGYVEDVPQALYGSCDVKNGESLSVWTLRKPSLSDNGTRVICQQLKNPLALAAVLHVYDNSTSYSTLIGCTIGGFFGILLVFGLLYIILLRSQRLQKCFGGSETEDDMTEIVSKD
ncbi:uncharacterized protein LOC114448601 [Parambassis ranga]|uniref:Uncharacterized protein LOC114448601 n=1 Tax=Parambassis ranga TaxID=210632 RepID=A0A6P7JWV6_9TELE|nr:uncharacterized protein LOC114448601 [Parambassis ranga]